MISLADVTEAQSRISGLVHRTPTVHSTSLSRRLGAEVFVKLELFQKTGSFKPRGAFNVMLSLSDEERARGVVGFSGGNFAQGMAYAGRTLGVDTLVLMPETTRATTSTPPAGTAQPSNWCPTSLRPWRGWPPMPRPAGRPCTLSTTRG